MNSSRGDQDRTARTDHAGPPVPPLNPAPAAPAGNRAAAAPTGKMGEKGAPNDLSPEEQLARFEEALKEEDWGHQPC